MNNHQPGFLEIAIKTIVTHSVTYLVMGLLAFTILDYAQFFSETSLKLTMRPVTDRIVMAGPLFQPIRGLLFGVVFYLLRETFFGKKNGWLVMWLTLVILGIIGTFGPSPGSLEGMIFTVHPLWVQLKGLPEVVLQSLALSALLFYWVNHPEKTWIHWVMGIVFFLGMAFPALGLLVTAPK